MAKKSTNKVKKQTNFTKESITPNDIDSDHDNPESYFIMTTQKSGVFSIEGPWEDADGSKRYNPEFYIVNDPDGDYDIEYIDGKWIAGREISPPYGDILVLNKKDGF